MQLLDLADERITAPVFGAIWRAPLGAADFSLHIAGASGAFKTELAALAQGHFGAGFDAHHLPCDWTWTENALEELAFAAKDAVLTVDDFRPPTDYRERDALMRKAERLFRAQGNRQGRGRLSRDSRLREARAPRGVIISTGEIYPRGQSLAGRILFIDLVKGEIESARLNACQHDRDAGRYASAMSAYICWLLPRLEQTHACVRQLAADITADMRGAGLHARTPGVLAELMAGAACFLAFAVECGAITPAQADELEQRIWRGLRAVGGGQAEHQLSQDPTRRFIELLNAALAQRLRSRSHDRRELIPSTRRPTVGATMRHAAGKRRDRGSAGSTTRVSTWSRTRPTRRRNRWPRTGARSRLARPRFGSG